MLSSKLWGLVLSCVLALAAQDVAAKRLGGGESLGKPSGNVSQRSDTAPAAAPSSVAAAGAPGALTAASKSGLGTVLGGVAAGLGLAWLASTLGFGEAVAHSLLMILIAVLVLGAVGLLLRRRSAAPSGLAYQAAGSRGGSGSGDSQLDPFTPRGYSAHNVGNDASARPWEQHPAMTEPDVGPMNGQALDGTSGWGVPDSFDVVGFLKASKAFRRSSWLLSPCSAAVFKPSFSSERAKRAQPSLLFTNTKACFIPRVFSTWCSAWRLPSSGTL